MSCTIARVGRRIWDKERDNKQWIIIADGKKIINISGLRAKKAITITGTIIIITITIDKSLEED